MIGITFSKLRLLQSKACVFKNIHLTEADAKSIYFDLKIIFSFHPTIVRSGFVRTEMSEYVTFYTTTSILHI